MSVKPSDDHIVEVKPNSGMTDDSEATLLLKVPESEPTTTWWQRHRIFVILCTAMALNFGSNAVLLALGPEIKKKYFNDSSRTAALWQSVVDTASSLLGLLVASPVGKMQDVVGRRTMLNCFFIFQTLSAVGLAITPTNPLPFMIFNAMNNVVTSATAWPVVADLYGAGERAKMYGILKAVQSFAAVLVVLDFALPKMGSIYVAIGLGVLGQVAGYFVPETLAKEKQVPLRESNVFEKNPLAPLRYVMRDRILLHATIMLSFYFLAQAGVGDIYKFYLQDRIGFSDNDNAMAIAEFSILQPLALLFLMPVLVKKLSPPPAMFVALCGMVVELATMAFAWTMWPILAFTVPGLVVSQLIVPVTITLIANCADEEMRGLRMNSIEAVSGLSAAIGPLLFGIQYEELPTSLSFLPFAVCCGFVIPAGIVAHRLHRLVQATTAEEAATGVQDGVVVVNEC